MYYSLTGQQIVGSTIGELFDIPPRYFVGLEKAAFGELSAGELTEKFASLSPR